MKTFFFGKKSLALLTLFVGLAITSCAVSTHKTHPDFAQRISHVKSYELIPPDIEMFEITTGEGWGMERALKVTRGFRAPRKNWNSRGNENVRLGIMGVLEQKGILIEDLSAQNPEAMDELKEIQALYRVVNASIRLHTFQDQTITEELEYFRALYTDADREIPKSLFTPFVFPEKQRNFVYSLGRQKWASKGSGKRFFLMVNGYDEVSSEERRGLVAAGVIVSNVVKSPIGFPGLPEAGHTSVGIAVVDDRGDILWYNAAGGPIFTVMDRNNAAKIMKQILEKIPGGEK